MGIFKIRPRQFFHVISTFCAQRIAETAFDIVSPGPSIKHVRLCDRSDRHKDRRSRRAKGNQPADIREGFASALQLVKDVSIREHASRMAGISFIVHCDKIRIIVAKRNKRHDMNIILRNSQKKLFLCD